MTNAQRYVTDARKAGVAAGTVAAEVLATGLLHGTAQTVLQCVLAVLGVFGVYQVPNKVKRGNMHTDRTPGL
jgi:uncharacterized protein YcfJ